MRGVGLLLATGVLVSSARAAEPADVDAVGPRTPAAAPAPAPGPDPAPDPVAPPVTDVPPVSGVPSVTDVTPPPEAPRAAPEPVPSPRRAPPPPLVNMRPPPRPERVHQGLYLGFQTGPAYFSASSEWEQGSNGRPGTREFSGPSLGFSLALGGTLAQRIALAGLITLEPVLSLSAKDENGDSLDVENVSFFLRGEGLLLDYYVSPSGGLHMLAALGLAQLDVDRGGDNPEDPTGSFWTLGVGYDWWAGDQTSVGVLARVSNASLETREASEDVDVEVFSFGLLVTATMN